MTQPPYVCRITMHFGVCRWLWCGLIPRRFWRVEAQVMSPFQRNDIGAHPLRNTNSCFVDSLRMRA